MTAEPLTTCTCTIKMQRTKGLYSTFTRTPAPGCPIHVVKGPKG